MEENPAGKMSRYREFDKKNHQILKYVHKSEEKEAIPGKIEVYIDRI
jgi:hypothetical protein